MNSAFYLPRRLVASDKTYTETELLAASKFIVVLAEPGAGKTELMGSLAKKLGAIAVTASRFIYQAAIEKNVPLVIDAVDELSKLDASGIYKLLGNAEAANPTQVYLSSRSSEWNNAATHAFSDFFGQAPLVVRLCDFDESEQRQIFNHHVPTEDFEAFRREVSRFDLETLLPNPQFLKLFADAYIESERHFIDKRSIFEQAVERLAKETNTRVARSHTALTITQKVDMAAEVFTKLLLSGAEGVCVSEASEHRMYPLLASLFTGDAEASRILETRLFKPGESTDQHRPVHKIVSEYCAAKYLTKRIADPADPLTLLKCLPIIAPNSAVRDELRGLLGWIAALGNKTIEESTINLDPYAVLANGDPSQLEQSSKRLLITRLKDIETEDPYFRRGDFWRRFSVAGFFTEDVVEEIKPLLSAESDGDLRDLILELLVGSPAIEQLRDELCQLTLTPTESANTRLLANRCLLGIDAGDKYLSELKTLISEASSTSLRISGETFKSRGPETFERDILADFCRSCSQLYPTNRGQLDRKRGERYFVKKFINELDLATCEWLLDELTKDLSCICGKKSYRCECRNGISQIVGPVLDRYFELARPPFDSLRVWKWVGNLNFYARKSTDQSKAVEVLRKDGDLRRGIIALVLGKLTKRDDILEARREKFGLYSHSGLHLLEDDYKFIVDHAFETDNLNLWTSCIVGHQYHINEGERGPNNLRRRMREQARKKTALMYEWAKANRITAKQFDQEERKWRLRDNRWMKREARKKEEIRTANINYVQNNRALVEGGRHWNCLVRFADLLLHNPDEIEEEFGDDALVRNALRNCVDFIAPNVPNLLKLAELECGSKWEQSIQILFAACLEIMRAKGNLESVDPQLLKALRTNIHVGYGAVSIEEGDTLKREIDRLVFTDAVSAESFIREYLQPQLAHSECNHPNLQLLRDDLFSHTRGKLSIEWLRRFSNLAFEPLVMLFDIASQYGTREELKEVIAKRCSEIMAVWPESTESEGIEKKRTFWLLRAFYFLDDGPEEYWDWLKADKETAIRLYERSGRLNRSEHPHWPKLASAKVESILNAFIDVWPKVDLPPSWGSDSPKKEKAYRFLTEVIWLINADDPNDAIPVLGRLLADSRFVNLHNDLKSIHSSQVRARALRDFEPPTPKEIQYRLDHDAVVTVEGLRQLVIEELENFQKTIDGGEFNSADRFYEKGERLDEVRSTEIIAERLNLRLESQNISVTPEHQLKEAKRSDFTVTKMIGGKRRLLVTEVKGQWHRELYTAASSQLHERYSIHPDAEQQGIFLAIWFGENEKVAGRKRHGIRNAQELQCEIEANLPQEIKGLIDVFVLDVSRSS